MSQSKAGDQTTPIQDDFFKVVADKLPVSGPIIDIENNKQNVV